MVKVAPRWGFAIGCRVYLGVLGSRVIGLFCYQLPKNVFEAIYSNQGCYTVLLFIVLRFPATAKVID